MIAVTFVAHCELHAEDKGIGMPRYTGGLTTA